MNDHDDGSLREGQIRLEGKIDALIAKVDGKFDAVMAKIEAGDRESLQLFKLQENELGHLAQIVANNSTRITTLATEGERRHGELGAEVDTIKQTLADFATVKRLVYGGAALILAGVVTALLTLVVVKP